MTSKEQLARDIKDVARQWEDGERFQAIMRDRGVTSYCLRTLLRVYLGDARYDRISREHRLQGRIAAGHMFTEGNHAHKLRANCRGTTRAEIGTIRKWKRYGEYHRYMKVSDGNGGSNWRSVAILIWEKLHGPVPRCHFVGFRDGDPLNDDPGNLYLVSRADCARLAGKKNGITRRIEMVRNERMQNATFGDCDEWQDEEAA